MHKIFLTPPRYTGGDTARLSHCCFVIIGNAVCITWQSLPTVLSFFAQCASNLPKLKDWLGASEGQLFWTPLLELLCTSKLTTDPLFCLQILTMYQERLPSSKTGRTYYIGI